MQNDLVLLERWREGDRAAGQELFSRHLPGVYQFFRHKVGTDAEDLVQTTFMSCLKARDHFRGQSSFRAYLFGIARHVLYTFLRRLPRGEHVDVADVSIPQVVMTPGSVLDHKRELDRIRAALGRMPAEQQLLLELHYWHDLDASALGEIFEASANAIRVRLLRARRVLRDELRRSGGEALVSRLTPDEADPRP